MGTKTARTSPWTYRGVLVGENGISALWTKTNGMIEESKLVELFPVRLMGPERNTWAERDLAAVLPRLATSLRKLGQEVSAPIVGAAAGEVVQHG